MHPRITLIEAGFRSNFPLPLSAISRYRNLHAQLSPLFPRSGANTIDIQWAFSFVCRPVARPQSAADGYVGGIRGWNRQHRSPPRANRNRVCINHFQLCIQLLPILASFHTSSPPSFFFGVTDSADIFLS